jgi:hypothetical protein
MRRAGSTRGRFRWLSFFETAISSSFKPLLYVGKASNFYSHLGIGRDPQTRRVWEPLN